MHDQGRDLAKHTAEMRLAFAPTPLPQKGVAPADVLGIDAVLFGPGSRR